MNDQYKASETNGLGIAGFVLSLVGLCSGGILSPIGLIISLVALGKRPKGLAIAGVVLGAVGSCGIILGIILLPLVVFAFAGLLVAAGATGLAAAVGGAAGPNIEAQLDTAFLFANIEQYHSQHNEYPMTLEEGLQKLSAGSPLRADHWNNPYLYIVAPDRSKYWLFSAGPDGIAGSADDIMSEATREKFGEPPTSAPTTPELPGPSDPPPPADGSPAAPAQPAAPAGG
jgi:hypothetical protein